MEFDRFDLLYRVEEGHEHATYDLSSSDMPPQRLSAAGGLRDLSLAENHVGGSPELRKELAKSFGGRPEEYVVTAGASEANFAVCAALVGLGDPVLVESPVYEPLAAIPRGLGGLVKYLGRAESHGFRVNVEELHASLPPGLRLLVLSNLHNPTGAAMDAGTVRAVAELAQEGGFYVLVDEIFRELAFEHPPPTIGGRNPQVIVTAGMSKFFGAGGLRIGWIRAAEPVRRKVRSVLDYMSVSPAGPSERIALALLRRKAKTASRNRRLIRAGRAVVREWAETTPGVVYEQPPGHLAFPKVDADTANLAHRLLTKHRTFIAPGESFGLPRHFRLNLGRGADQLEPGLARIRKELRGK